MKNKPTFFALTLSNGIDQTFYFFMDTKGEITNENLNITEIMIEATNSFDEVDLDYKIIENYKKNSEKFYYDGRFFAANTTNFDIIGRVDYDFLLDKHLKGSLKQEGKNAYDCMLETADEPDCLIVLNVLNYLLDIYVDKTSWINAVKKLDSEEGKFVAEVEYKIEVELDMEDCELIDYMEDWLQRFYEDFDYTSNVRSFNKRCFIKGEKSYYGKPDKTEYVTDVSILQLYVNIGDYLKKFKLENYREKYIGTMFKVKYIFNEKEEYEDFLLSFDDNNGQLSCNYNDLEAVVTRQSHKVEKRSFDDYEFYDED